MVTAQAARLQSRNSSIELFRVVTMLFIIAHHYVVNSGLSEFIYQDVRSAPSIFLLIFGAWGKTGINCFVLITGYYMCQSNISAKKWAKLFLEIEFYNLLFYLVFVLGGYEIFSKRGLLAALSPLTAVSDNFLSGFLLFYLCIPFLNMLLHQLSEIMHLRLIALGVFMYTGLGSLLFLNGRFPPLQVVVTMNYVSWFIVLYVIAAYFRLYPKKLFENRSFWGRALFLSVALSVLSILIIIKKDLLHIFPVYYFLSDSNKILALCVSVCAFMLFKNLPLKYTPWINAMGSSTFGILLIHTNNAALRQWLWQDFLKNTAMYSSPYLIIHAFASVLGIFIVCFLLDQLRQHFIERPFFIWWDKHFDHWADRFSHLEHLLCKKLQIGEE